MSAIEADWLDGDTVKSTNCGATAGVSTNAIAGSSLTYSSYPTSSGYVSYYPSYVTLTRPIRLSMGEVERLRKAAKSDEALKAILKKFTAQIEVVVEF